MWSFKEIVTKSTEIVLSNYNTQIFILYIIWEIADDLFDVHSRIRYWINLKDRWPYIACCNIRSNILRHEDKNSGINLR